MKLVLTEHATQQLAIREIEESWLKIVVFHPISKVTHPIDRELYILHGWINERHKWLKVIVKYKQRHAIIITAHFDRSHKGVVPL